MSYSSVVSQPADSQFSRFADLQDEELAVFYPITGVMDATAMSIYDAAKSIGLKDIDPAAYTAMESGRQLTEDDPYGLTADECGAFNLYTGESEFYAQLNKNCRMRSRRGMKPFLPAMKHMLTGRAKLPKFRGTGWRCAKGVDLRSKYHQGKEVWWWSWSSASLHLKNLQDDQFLGRTGLRTIFMIEMINGVDISRYSVLPEESEVLLAPGTRLQVVSTINMGNDLFQVHLRELECLEDMVS